MAKNAKLELLYDIQQNKEILFGPLSASCTKAEKSALWCQIFILSKANGYSFPEGKDWTYLRDTVWPNLKKGLKKKLDLTRKTGAAGGKKMALTASELLIQEIIGKETPVLTGLSVSESMEEESESNDLSFNGETDDFDIASRNSASRVSSRQEGGDEAASSSAPMRSNYDSKLTARNAAATSRRESATDVVKGREIMRAVASADFSNGGDRIPLAVDDYQRKPCNKRARESSVDGEMAVLKKQRMKLQLQNLELTNYKTSLEIAKLLGPGYAIQSPAPACLKLIKAPVSTAASAAASPQAFSTLQTAFVQRSVTITNSSPGNAASGQFRAPAVSSVRPQPNARATSSNNFRLASAAPLALPSAASGHGMQNNRPLFLISANGQLVSPLSGHSLATANAATTQSNRFE